MTSGNNNRNKVKAKFIWPTFFRVKFTRVDKLGYIYIYIYIYIKELNIAVYTMNHLRHICNQQLCMIRIRKHSGLLSNGRKWGKTDLLVLIKYQFTNLHETCTCTDYPSGKKH